jgi:hypothetical protein
MFVSGHDFSRAVKAGRMRALAPEVLLSRPVQLFPEPDIPPWMPLLAHTSLSHIEENIGHTLSPSVGALNQQDGYQVIVRVDLTLGPESSALVSRLRSRFPPPLSGFVSGHDFSRAVKAGQMRALAPEVLSSCPAQSFPQPE